jgi:hypothetical protein
MGKILGFMVAAMTIYTGSANAAAVLIEGNTHPNFCRCVVITSECLTGSGVAMMEKLDLRGRDFKTWKGPFMQNTFTCDSKENVELSLYQCEQARKTDESCSFN